MSKIMSYIIEGEELGHVHYDEITEMYEILREPSHETQDEGDAK